MKRRGQKRTNKGFLRLYGARANSLRRKEGPRERPLGNFSTKEKNGNDDGVRVIGDGHSYL